jgi:hypothetical protein
VDQSLTGCRIDRRTAQTGAGELRIIAAILERKRGLKAALTQAG